MADDHIVRQAKALWEAGVDLIKKGNDGEGMVKVAEAVLVGGGRGIEAPKNQELMKMVSQCATKHCVEGDEFMLEAWIIMGHSFSCMNNLPMAERCIQEATKLPGEERGSGSHRLWHFLSAMQALQGKWGQEHAMKNITKAIDLLEADKSISVAEFHRFQCFYHTCRGRVWWAYIQPGCQSFYTGKAYDGQLFVKCCEAAYDDFKTAVEVGKAGDKHFADSSSRLIEVEQIMRESGLIPGAAREKRLAKKKKKEEAKEGSGSVGGGAAAGSEPQMSSRKAAEAEQIKYGMHKFQAGSVSFNDLEPWGDDGTKNKFSEQFAFAEGIMAMSLGQDNVLSDPQSKLRQLLLTLGQSYDEGARRLIARNDAKERDVILHIVECRKWGELPMFAVLYYAGSITGDATVQKEHHCFLGSGGVGVEVEASVEVLDHLVGMLEFNATMLSNKFKKKEAKKHADYFSVSAIVPLQKPIEKSKSAKPPCKVCGDTGKSWCSRCKNVWYCGKDCQLIDWKEHKPICRAPDQSTYVDVHVTEVEEHMKGMFMNSISMNMSQNRSNANGKMQIAGEPITGITEDKHETIKIQVPLGGGLSSPMGTHQCMVTNKNKSLVLQFNEKMCRPKKGYRQIVDMVHNLGMRVTGFGPLGVKAFVSATVVDGGKVLRIFMNKLEPPQSW